MYASKRKLLQAILARIVDERKDLCEPLDLPYRICPATMHLHRNWQRVCEECMGAICLKMKARGVLDDGSTPLPYCDRPNCGAKTRSGAACQNKVVPGRTKCKFHGGLSTGPKTAGGKARIASAQKARQR